MGIVLRNIYASWIWETNLYKRTALRNRYLLLYIYMGIEVRNICFLDRAIYCKSIIVCILLTVLRNRGIH